MTRSASHGTGLSLEGMHGSVAVPSHHEGWWKHWRAFVGPAILVSVGYMDPGNWGTDLQAGAQFKYGLLWVVGLASLMARGETSSSPPCQNCCALEKRVGRHRTPISGKLR
jgi:hypothetical protein